MIKFFIFFIIFLSYQNFCNASVKQQIVNRIENVSNLSFEFKQTINGENETGECKISFPNKIFCKYEDRYNKILVSNGKSLVMKSDKNNEYYLYPLENTPLSILLDKRLIVEKIKENKIEDFEKNYLIVHIKHQNQMIKIFFSRNTFNLLGWAVEDIYQNLSTTFITNLSLNNEFKKDLFKLPKMN